MRSTCFLVISTGAMRSTRFLVISTGAMRSIAQRRNLLLLKYSSFYMFMSSAKLQVINKRFFLF